MPRRRSLLPDPLALSAPPLRAQASAERFPERPIRVLLPFAAGVLEAGIITWSGRWPRTGAPCRSR